MFHWFQFFNASYWGKEGLVIENLVLIPSFLLPIDWKCIYSILFIAMLGLLPGIVNLNKYEVK